MLLLTESVAQRRLGGGLRPALPVPRVRLPAGDEQRGLARDAEVRNSGARSHRIRAVAGAARPRRDICQHTSSRPLFAALFVTPRNKDDKGVGVPTDQLSHNHCDCTDGHCNSHIIASCVCFCASLCPISYHKSIGGRCSFHNEFLGDDDGCRKHRCALWSPRKTHVTSWCVLLLLPLQPGNLFIMVAGRERRRRRES